MILFIDAIVHKLSSSKSVFSFQFNLSFLCKCDLVYEERLNWKLKTLLDELNLWTIASMDKIKLSKYWYIFKQAAEKVNKQLKM